ncbi:phenylalanine--tRna ligase, beta subunit protein [Cardiosporidium cionae]|uniref:Phenylalanyl-tRNA synthetase beta subunit n=1 Tax=Cardiosporidium cionae TaxID=476202 RepID=A0ABQ7J7A4_9APIC|nr:phenylalanine--tRna ligase, beta subunit protein [Cardiosporidium cionae]|eukprot:KAF8819862.1 phenylalanine--tRna ligase, beta subunit protein [Cardiosporidium cionae]
MVEIPYYCFICFKVLIILKCSISMYAAREAFEELCFQFGIELDDVVEDEEHRIIYKIEIPANRHDLLCVEGISRALNVFRNKIENIPLHCKTSSSQSFFVQQLTVKAQTARIRPYVVAAILRNIVLDAEAYRSFIDLQDKLHHNIGRKRSLVAIGTHDLDTLKGPFVFDAVSPLDIHFQPLNHPESLRGDCIMQLYETHAQLKAYLPIIRDSEVYPIIYDSEGTVLSLPPIINGDHSKISLDTRNILIECTATDLIKAEITLNTLVSMFSEYCSPPFEVEQVSVSYDEKHPLMGGKKILYPRLEKHTVTASVQFFRDFTGIKELTGESSKELLQRMLIPSTINKEQPDTLIADIPLTRSDVAIAYGFNTIAKSVFPYLTHVPLNALSEQIRRCLAISGFLECLNWGLCSFNEAFDYLGRSVMPSIMKENVILEANYTHISCAPPVRLINPKTKEFEIVRTTLLPGLLKTLHSNKGRELPIKLFEVGDVACLDSTAENGARNHRLCSFLYANRENSGLEEVHGALDDLMERFHFFADYTIAEGQRTMENNCDGSQSPYYTLTPSQDPAFLPGRRVAIRVEPQGVEIGIMGVIHPQVLKQYSINMPVALVELDVGFFLKWVEETDLYED